MQLRQKIRYCWDTAAFASKQLPLYASIYAATDDQGARSAETSVLSCRYASVTCCCSSKHLEVCICRLTNVKGFCPLVLCQAQFTCAALQLAIWL